MKPFQTCTAVLGSLIVCCCGAWAIEPSHYGKLGNPEEPATRPYKALWRGLKALKYQTGHSFKSGNEKMPVVGTVEGFRGVRRGLIELGASTYRGMAGQYPAPVDELSWSNQKIEEDRRRAALADLPSTVAIIGAAGGGTAGMVFGPGLVTVAQSETDRAAMSEEAQARIAEAARATRQQQWPSDTIERNTPRPHGLKYVAPPKPAPGETKNEAGPNAYSGDMIQKARRGGIANSH